MSDLKFRVWLGKRFWFFDITTGFNAENEDQTSEPEQYIKLKDKNGTDIYDGDYISINGSRFTRLVKWSESSDSGNQHDYGYMSVGYRFNQYCTERDIEIVGNIHQNPELAR